jgi:hypothetical protein
MSLNLIKQYCEYVTKAASEQGWKLALALHGFAWQKDGETKQYIYVTNDARDALHQACMTLDNDFLKLPQLEIK